MAGDFADAIEQGRRAAREFTRQQRPEWASLARFTVLVARLAAQSDSQSDPPADSQSDPPVSVAALERAADELSRGGWRIAALRYATGDRRGADSAVRAALRIIDEHRASFGATDLRAHAGGHRVEVAELGRRMALLDGRPARVLVAAERGRASHLLLPQVRPPDDLTLANSLAELRAIVAELGKLRSASADGSVGGSAHESAGSAARLVRRQVSLERQIRDHSRRQAHDTGAAVQVSRPVPPRVLIGALGDRVLAEFVYSGDELHAGDRDGRPGQAALAGPDDADQAPGRPAALRAPVARPPGHLGREPGGRFDLAQGRGPQAGQHAAGAAGQAARRPAAGARPDRPAAFAVVPLPDAETEPLMVELHRLLA